jgi:hypothetical protein
MAGFIRVSADVFDTKRRSGKGRKPSPEFNDLINEIIDLVPGGEGLMTALDVTDLKKAYANAYQFASRAVKRVNADRTDRGLDPIPFKVGSRTLVSGDPVLAVWIPAAE